MKKIVLAIALALAACANAQYSNQATQRWTLMRIAEAEARLRAELNSVVVSTNYASAQDFTNAVQSVALTATSQTAAALVEVYNANFAVAMSGSIVTQYMVYAASDAAKAAGLTNALPIGAKFVNSQEGEASIVYHTPNMRAELSFSVEGGEESMGYLVLEYGTANERAFNQSQDNEALFTQTYPTENPSVSFVIMKTVMPR